MTNDTHECPLCHGSGKVTEKVALAKVTVRDRAKYNANMRKINAAARARAKTKSVAII